MKKLDLNAYGVSEMTKAEMRQIRGGSRLLGYWAGRGAALVVNAIEWVGDQLIEARRSSMYLD